MVYHARRFRARTLVATALIGSTAMLPGAALAQEAKAATDDETAVQQVPVADAAEQVHSEADDDFHTIYVIGAGLGRLDLLAGTSAVSGEELQRNLSGQVGEVLEKLPGVSATSFAPGASRPVLRGFQGDRVRVLTDGLGAIDASNTSADHAVTIDPLTAERIEVLRGPAVLLYGGSAIGGAVNVLDKRIPRRVPDEAAHIDMLAAADTAHDLREVGASLDLPLAAEVALHLDAAWRETGELEIPSFALSDGLRAELLAEADEEEAAAPEEAEELREAADRRAVVPGTATETFSAGSGIAWIGSDASLGVSIGYYDSYYGVPERPGAGHHGEEDEGAGEGEEGVAIDLEQLRLDLRGELSLGDGFFESLRTRWGWSDYTHTELEGGTPGTTFDVSGIEGRLELVQAARGGWGGSIGAQYTARDFAAVGEEAYVAPNETESIAFFALQEVEFGPATLQAGARFEHAEALSDPLAIERSFDTFSAALGASYEVAPDLRLGANLSRAARAPTAEELFADGPHIATQQYEVGNPDLDPETAIGVEAYLRGGIGAADFSLAVYRNWFDGFVTLFADGSEIDDLPVYRILQADADHFGIEGELSVPLWQDGDRTLLADIRGDYVRAELSDGTPIPRIPPLSLLGALEWQSDRFDVRGELQWFAEQDRVAPLETPTGSFALANLTLAWKALRGSSNLTLMLQANNIFDAEGRRHASFTKDFVPLAGRNFKLSARASF